jgi:O-antigen ligase
VTLLSRLQQTCRDYDLLAVVYIIFVASIFFVTSDIVSYRLYVWTVVPLAVLMALPFAARTMLSSIILISAAVYLAAVGFWTYHSVQFPPHEVAGQMKFYARVSVQILSFLLVTAFLVATSPRFLEKFFVALCPIVALSALINMAIYAYSTPLPIPLVSYRLVAAIGTPRFTNSTHISSTYALFLVGGLSILVACQLSRVQRIVLQWSAPVLVAGILMTQARGAIAAVVAGTLVALAQRRTAQKKLILGLAAAFAVAMLIPALHEAILSRGQSYRLELWQRYLAMAAQAPFAGVGHFANIEIIMGDGAVLNQPHNVILWGQIRGGIVAAAAVAVMVAACIYWCWRHWRKNAAIVPLALVATMLVSGMVEVGLFPGYPTWPWVTYWLPVGISVAAEVLARAPAAASA